MKLLSIDPGLTGAIALFEDGVCVDVMPMPWMWITKSKKKKKVINVPELDSMFRIVNPNMVVIEKVHAMPGNGATSMFSFGYAYGVVVAMSWAHCSKVLDATPQEWKKHHNLIGSEKKEATILAKKLCTHVTSSGKADAYLIGVYALQSGLCTLKQ